jgi:hypothetical protein
MHLTISYFDGRRVEAIVLAVSADRMRISIPGCDDATELRMAGDFWISEAGEVIEIESMVVGADFSTFAADVRRVARSSASCG